MVTTVMKAYN